MSLRAKLILIFLGLSVVPLAALSFLSYTNSIRSLRDLVERDNRVAATDLQRRVSHLNGEIRSRVEDVARLPELQDLTPAGLKDEGRAARLAQAMQARVGDRWSYFSDLEFQPVVVRRGALDRVAAVAPPPPVEAAPLSPPAPPVPQVPVAATVPATQEAPVVRIGDAQNWSMKVILPDLTGLVDGSGARTVREYMLDFKDGAPTEESVSRMQGEMVENLVRLPGFILQSGGDGGIRLRNLLDGLEEEAGTGRPLASGPPVSPETGLPTTAVERRAFFRRLEETERRGTQAIRLPVRNPDGEIGTVVAHIRPDRLLAQVFDRTTLEEGEIAFAVDPNGRLHGSTPEDLEALGRLGLVGAEISAGTVAGMSGGALTGEASAPAVSADPEALARAVRDPEWISVIERDEQTGYVFGIVRPVGRELARIRTAAATNLMLGFAFIGLAGSGVIVFSHRVTRGLGVLSAGARRIAGGDLAHRIASHRRDEVGQLAEAFNDMAMNLEESRSRLVAQERVQRELEIARSIQRDFLPQGDLGSGDLDIVGRSITSLEVGGDFFNVLPLGNRRTAILIADVVGKGIPAALLMAELQATLRTLLRYDTDVTRVMGLVNAEVARNKADHIYLTGFLGLLDHARGTLVYVNAGHPPVLLLRATGGMVELGPTARPIGLFEDSVMTARSVEIGVGDLLLLYTDGVVECSAAEGDEFYGAARLQSLLRGAGKRPLAAILDELEERLKGFHGPGSFDDDATFVIGRVRTAGEAVRASTVPASASAKAATTVDTAAGVV